MGSRGLSVSQCAECGGKGVGVVLREARCAHCLRLGNAARRRAPSALEAAHLARGFEDVSPEGDLSLLKRVVQAGDASSAVPGAGCPARLHVLGRCCWDGAQWLSIYETTRERDASGVLIGGTDEPVEVQLLRSQSAEEAAEDEERREAMDPMYVGLGRCHAWELVATTMRCGERCEVLAAPQWAFGAAGRAPKVGPHESVLIDLELVSFAPPLPCFPSRAEMEQSRLEREAEERRRLEENPPPTLAQRLVLSQRDREAGNAAFKAGDWAAARKAYDAAFVSLFYSQDEYSFVLSDGERAELDQAKLGLHLNRAACKLKQEQPDAAVWDCTKALELDPACAKAHFRRAQAHTARLAHELDKQDRGEFWVLEKAWAVLKEARRDLAALLDLAVPGAGAGGPAAVELLRGAKLDPAVVAARADIAAQEERLRRYTVEYRAQEKNLFKDKIWKEVESRNELARKAELSSEEELRRCMAAQELADMPDLDDDAAAKPAESAAHPPRAPPK